MNKIYVVRSAEFDPVHFAAVPTLEDAKAVIVYLEERDEAQDVYDQDYDYDIVESFPDARAAISHLGEVENG